MNPKHALLQQYAEAKLQETVQAEALNKALQAINPENCIFGLRSPKSERLLDSVMEYVAGETLMGWVYWWMYDCEHGTRHWDFTVEGRDYTVTDLTFEQFLEIVDASN